MSKQTLDAIHKAIQAHLDESKDESHVVMDFVVARASVTEDGTWCIGYIASEGITPHGTAGLLSQAQDVLKDDLKG